MSNRVDEDAIIAYINQHVAEHGERPLLSEVAEAFGVSGATVGTIAAVRHEEIHGARRQGGRQMVDRTAEVMRFVEQYMAEHGWAPSQREIAVSLDIPLHTANRTLRVLHSQGLIRLGEHARQIQIVGSVMKAAEEAL